MIPITDISGQSTYHRGQLQGPPAAFIWHHTGERGTPSDIINTLNSRGLGVQYIMDRDGSIYQALPNGARGAHIQNSPDGRFSNDNTVGMEVIANDNNDLTQAQVDSGRAFAQQYAQQHPGIQFLGHGQVNPGHKEADEGRTLTSVSPGYSGPAFKYTVNTTDTAPATQGQTQTPGGTVTGNDNRMAVFKALTGPEIGLNPQQALGVMWSMGGESGGTLSSNALEKGTGAGYGLLQWTGIRRTALEAFAKQQGKPVSDPGLQLDYLKSELLGAYRPVLDHLKTVTTPDAAARVWTAEMEKPKVNNSDARIAQGAHVGTVDANGNFVAGDAKPGSYATPAGGGSTATPGTPAPSTQTPQTPPLMTPEESWNQSLGATLANIGNMMGKSSGPVEDPPDPPPIRTLAMETPNPQTQVGDVGSMLSRSVLPTLTDPTASITQGAPSMTQMLNYTGNMPVGQVGTDANFNYLDPRRTISPSTSFRGVRLG